MSGQRAQRMREGMKRETSEILRTMKDPRIGFVSVTDVEVSPDLRHAKVFVSVYGDEEDKATTLDALVKAQGFVRSELGKRIRLRHTPEIVFHPDDSIERGARINELLRSVAQPDARGGEEAGTGEDEERREDGGSDE